MVFFYLLILSLPLTQLHWLGPDAGGPTVELGRAARSRVEKQQGVAALRDAWRQFVCAAEKISR